MFCLARVIRGWRMLLHAVFLFMKTEKFCRLMKWSVAAACAAWLAGGLFVESYAQTPPPPGASAPPPKFKEFNEVVKGCERFEGFFNLYQTNDTLYAEIKGGVLDQPILSPIAIARGMASAGQPLNFGDEWILVFHREGDKIQVIRRNIHYQAPAGTPLEKAVKQNYTDSILLALPIVTLNGANPVIDFSQIYFTDFANLRMGQLDRNRTSWHKIKTFANNIELEVEATFMMGQNSSMAPFHGDDGVADGRGVTLVIHYSLAKLPDSGYKSRLADNRVGHFISASRDFGSTDPDSTFVRQINRWRLEKADPKSRLSPPKKQLVWWVEDTVPHEYRPYVQEGILEWNKAFEKIGFRDAIGVRWQNERDDFDPEDINYCTFRWITTSMTYAMSGLRANPLTGEMIDGDVIFDASWIRYWKTQYAFLVGKSSVGAEGGLESYRPIMAAEIISPIMASKYGYGLPMPLLANRLRNQMSVDQSGTDMPELVPAEWTPMQFQLSRRLAQGRFNTCQCVAGMQPEFALAAIAMAAESKTNLDGKLPDEFLRQAIKEVVMHEVGHSLGLRHNFHGSTMLKPEEINDTAITRVKGMSASIMDYTPINIAPKGQKQGDYASTTLGPYDYWAIEYAYKPIEGDEPAELKQIAGRSSEQDLAYGTDEDMYLNDDPFVNVYDLTSNPMKYGQDRIALAAELLKNLDENIVKDGESWARLRQAFSVLLGQYGNGTYLAVQYIGGQAVSRDFKGSKDAHDPVTPIAGDTQREALRFLVDKILSTQAFEFPPKLLRRLTEERWYHWGDETMSLGGGINYPINERVLSIQRIVLNQCLNGSVLSRIQNQELQAESGANPIKIVEIFQMLTDGVWSEIKAGGKDEMRISLLRRNLQREHLQRLCTMVLGSRRNPYDGMYGYVILLGGSGGSVPADARSLARLHLQDLSKSIQESLENQSLKKDKATEAHLRDCQDRVKKVLEASYMAND